MLLVGVCALSVVALLAATTAHYIAARGEARRWELAKREVPTDQRS